MKHSRSADHYAGCVLAVFLLAAPPSMAADAHVHGRASLQIAVDANRLLLESTSPLDNLVGFEHSPRNEKQTAAVRRMAERLHQPTALFVPTPAAGCTPSSVKLESPVLDPTLLAPQAAQPAAPHPPTKSPHKRGHGEHAALSAEIVYACTSPDQLAYVETTIFDVFTHVRRIDARAAGPRKQTAATLTTRNRRIAW